MVVEPDRARHVMFDGPTTLTRMAAGTTSIRVGTLVSSLHFRHPVTLTKATMTLDHLSAAEWNLRSVWATRRPAPPQPVWIGRPDGG